MSAYSHARAILRARYWCALCRIAVPAHEVRTMRVSATTLAHFHEAVIDVRGELVPVDHRLIRPRRK